MKAEIQRDLEKKAPRDSKWVYQGRIVQLRVDTFLLEKRKKTTELVHHPGAVVILAVDSSERILLVRQWRRAIEQIILELPAGTLEKGEDPLHCAGRELQEETGFRAQDIAPMGGFYSAPGFCDEYLHLFFAKNLIHDPLPADEDEQIDLVPVFPKEAIQWIENGKIADAKTIAGILRYIKRQT